MSLMFLPFRDKHMRWGEGSRAQSLRNTRGAYVRSLRCVTRGRGGKVKSSKFALHILLNGPVEKGQFSQEKGI